MSSNLWAACIEKMAPMDRVMAEAMRALIRRETTLDVRIGSDYALTISGQRGQVWRVKDQAAFDAWTIEYFGCLYFEGPHS